MAEAESLVLAIDQGTSSTKSLLVDARGEIVSRGKAPLAIDYPEPGWVEQSPAGIWSSVLAAVEQCLAGAPAARIAAVGLSTQRESILLWDRATGEPLGPMLGWQDRRTSSECRRLAPELGTLVREVSGLPLDPMFSALKARWLLDRYDPDRARSARGELCLGTVDAWLTRCLTGRHQIEVGNASRTQLLDVRLGSWSDELFAAFGVPLEALPDVVASGAAPRGDITGIPALRDVPLTAVLADSHAALFAHGARAPGPVKATFGTGSSVIGLVDGTQALSEGLCLTIAWQVDSLTHAAEGNIQATGATVSWLAGLLDLTPAEVLTLAETSDSDGVVLVPAFNGLGAPWWDDEATALISGISLATTRTQLARAAFESVAAQVADLTEALLAGLPPGTDRVLLADGGISANDAMMQLQADLLGVPVERARHQELSALGAAHLAGLTAGVWSEAQLRDLARERDVFSPGDGRESAGEQYARWRAALARSRWRPPSG